MADESQIPAYIIQKVRKSNVHDVNLRSCLQGAGMRFRGGFVRAASLNKVVELMTGLCSVVSKDTVCFFGSVLDMLNLTIS